MLGASGDEGRDNVEAEVSKFIQRLRSHFNGYSWEFVGVKKASGELIPVPQVSNCITAIVETDAVEQLRELTEELGADIIRPDHTRQYPDVTLTGGPFGDAKIALDVKTARRDPKNDERLKSPMTLGSYAGYFREPQKESPWTKFPYGSYAHHVILCFAYEWDDSENSQDMVSNIEVIVGEKWKLAAKTTGTGTTSHIASAKRIPELHDGTSVFTSEEEFEEYWRNY